MRASSSSSSRPARCSTRACARELSRSYGASRQSNCTETDSAASASAGPPANRPPHSRMGSGRRRAGRAGSVMPFRLPRLAIRADRWSRRAAILLGSPHSSTKPLASDWSNMSPVS